MAAKRVNISIGSEFNRLVVIGLDKDKNGRTICKCRCICGNTTLCYPYQLKKDIVVSCGCYRKERRILSEKQKMETDLIGFSTDTYSVVSYSGNNLWKCRCVCGNYFETSRRSILNGVKKSCGCLNHKHMEISGKRFDMLIAVEYLGKSTWRCKCDCGNEKNVKTHDLIAKRVHSCGCLGRTRQVASIRKNRKLSRKNYPQVLIKSLAYDSDKILAKNRELTKKDVVMFFCEKHGNYRKQVSEFLRTVKKGNSGCPKCAKSFSSQEDEIRRFVSSLGFSSIKDRTILDGKEIDIYIPELRIGIEYNGSAFHASKNGVYENKDKNYHMNKFILAKERGINLITIFDKDFICNKSLVFKNISDVIFNRQQESVTMLSTIVTNNCFGNYSFLKELGYEEDHHIKPSFYEYHKYTVYDCGYTVWKMKKE